MNLFKGLISSFSFAQPSFTTKPGKDLQRITDSFVIIPEHHQINDWLRIISFAFEGTNTLIILDDCASSKDVKKRSDELVKLAFSARQAGISVWVLTQQMSSIAKPFRENIACLVTFFTPSAKDMKTVFEDYAGELTKDEKKR